MKFKYKLTAKALKLNFEEEEEHVVFQITPDPLNW